MATQQPFYPYLPEHMDWDSWNGNLIMWYSAESIGIHPEIDWQITAKNVSQSPTFSAYPVPDPDTFENWQDWALEFTQIINGPSR
jgi:hypothetical protein